MNRRPGGKRPGVDLPGPGRRDLVWAALLLLPATALLVLGWRLFFHLTDDAYISFRYVSNSILGHGYVWNAPPFRPVEGYSNFLWVVMLDAVWRLFGLAPPRSANLLTLLFSFGNLLLVAWLVLRIDWCDRLRRHRMLFVALALLFIVTNRTFLAWSSSGLETALFDFLLLLWICLCLRGPRSALGWGLATTSAAALMSLTRPDGLLFLAITLGLVFWPARGASVTISRLWRLASASPALAVLAHLIWRRSFYGEWLPNTYYAKHTGLWLESGARYALSFILEYGLWVWLGLALYVLVTRVRARPGRRHARGGGKGTAPSPPRAGPHRLVVPGVCLALALHAGYYTFVIGGDHFEYRVYSHLILLAPLSFLWLCNAARLRAGVSTALLAAFVLLACPIPWTHWALTRDLQTREETHKLRVSVADSWPRGLAWYARIFDRLQFWLIDHYVCVRHQEHKINSEFIASLLPSRQEGLELGADRHPVFAFPAVGIAAWVLPHIHIIDVHGLNDYVIARTPPDRSRQRLMAHEKLPPLGYVECFAPNVMLRRDRQVVIAPRPVELRARDIESCEQRWTQRVRQAGLP